VGLILPFAVSAVILAFALVEWQLGGDVTIIGIIAYFRASVRVLSIVVPLHAAILAGVWSVGALRLWWKRERPWFRFSALGFGLLWLETLVELAWFAWLLAPLDFALHTAFSGDGFLHIWWIGFGSGLFYLGVGLALLAWSTTRMNLGRAAQETMGHAAVQLARSQWQFDIVNMLHLRQRLGMTRTPSRPPIRGGAWVLVWKDALQFWRGLHILQLGRWAWLFGLYLGAFLLPDIVLRLVFWGLWTVSLGELTTYRLRNDLAHWWVLRSLPFRNRDLLLAELALSGGLGILLGWAALLVGRIPLAIGFAWGILLPFLVVNVAFSAMQDIMRRSKARALLSPSIAEENVPQQNVLGVLPGMIIVAVLVSLLELGSTRFAPPVIGLGVFVLAAVITFRNMKVVLAAFRWIE